MPLELKGYMIQDARYAQRAKWRRFVLTYIWWTSNKCRYSILNFLSCSRPVNWPVYRLCSKGVLLLSQVWRRQELPINLSVFYTTKLFYCSTLQLYNRRLIQSQTALYPYKQVNDVSHGGCTQGQLKIFYGWWDKQNEEKETIIETTFFSM